MPTSKKVYSILYSLLFLHEDLYLIPTILRIIRYFFTRSRTAILYILLHSPFHFFHLIFVTLITDNVFFFRRIFHDIKQLHRRELRHIRRFDRIRKATRTSVEHQFQLGSTQRQIPLSRFVHQVLTRRSTFLTQYRPHTVTVNSFFCLQIVVKHLSKSGIKVYQ